MVNFNTGSNRPKVRTNGSPKRPTRGHGAARAPAVESNGRKDIWPLPTLCFTAVPEGTRISIEAIVPHPEGPPPTAQAHGETFRESLAEIEPALAGLLPRLAYRYTQPQTGQLGLGPKSRAQVGLREPATKASVAGCYPFLPSPRGVLSNTFSNCSSIPRRKGAKTMTG